MRLRQFLEDFVERHRGLRLGRAFGRPGVYAGRRLFACATDAGIIVKLPNEVARREIRQGAAPHTKRPGTAASWIAYRPRTDEDARRLWPILELAARHAATAAPVDGAARD